MRRLAHGFGPADQRHLGVADADVLRRADDRLKARATEAVHGQRRLVLGDAGAQPDVSRAVNVLGRGLHDVAEDDLIDLGGLEPGLRQRRLGGDRA